MSLLFQGMAVMGLFPRSSTACQGVVGYRLCGHLHGLLPGLPRSRAHPVVFSSASRLGSGGSARLIRFDEVQSFLEGGSVETLVWTKPPGRTHFGKPADGIDLAARRRAPAESHPCEDRLRFAVLCFEDATMQIRKNPKLY